MAIIFIVVLCACSDSQSQQQDAVLATEDQNMQENLYASIGEIPTPVGFERMKDCNFLLK